MNKVLISKEIPTKGMELLKAHGLEVVVLDPTVSLAHLNKSNLEGVVGIISMLSDSINEDFLAKAADLKVITNFAVGINNLDISALKKKGILIGNTPEVLTEATAELTIGLLIMSMRNLYSASNSVYNGQWHGFNPLEFLGPTLFRKNVSILGFGRIGKKVGEILYSGFGNTIAVLDRSEKKNDELKNQINYPINIETEDDFLKKCDVLILTAPLTNETEHWLNQSRLGKLKKTVTIVNTGRGNLVHEPALITFLETHEKVRYATDVMGTEPLPIDHPLAKLHNVTMLPHIGSATFEAREEMSLICAKNIIMGLSEKVVFKGPNC